MASIQSGGCNTFLVVSYCYTLIGLEDSPTDCGGTYLGRDSVGPTGASQYHGSPISPPNCLPAKEWKFQFTMTTKTKCVTGGFAQPMPQSKETDMVALPGGGFSTFCQTITTHICGPRGKHMRPPGAPGSPHGCHKASKAIKCCNCEGGDKDSEAGMGCPSSVESTFTTDNPKLGGSTMYPKCDTPPSPPSMNGSFDPPGEFDQPTMDPWPSDLAQSGFCESFANCLAYTGGQKYNHHISGPPVDGGTRIDGPLGVEHGIPKECVRDLLGRFGPNGTERGDGEPNWPEE